LKRTATIESTPRTTQRTTSLPFVARDGPEASATKDADDVSLGRRPEPSFTALSRWGQRVLEGRPRRLRFWRERDNMGSDAATPADASAPVPASVYENASVPDPAPSPPTAARPTPAPKDPAKKFKVKSFLGPKLLHEYVFDKDLVTIGRDPGCDVHLDNQAVSRKHAAIAWHDGVHALIDKKADNRSLVNGKPANEFTLLNNNDEILVGKFTLKFECQATKTFNVDFDPSDSDMGRLGGSTLAISKRQTTRLVKERGRVRGFVHSKQNKILVAEGFTVGKASECDLKLTGFFAPRRALIIITRGVDDYRLYNVSPRPQLVTVNGKPVSNFVVLANNDLVRVAELTFSFAISEDADTAAK
jgi:hypothetical protein